MKPVLWFILLAIGLIAWRREAHVEAAASPLHSAAAPNGRLAPQSDEAVASPSCQVDLTVSRLRRAIASDRTIETGDSPTGQLATASLPSADLEATIRRLRLDELSTPAGAALIARWLDHDPLAAFTWLADKPLLHASEATAAGTLFAARSEALNSVLQAPASAWKDQVLVEAGRVLADATPERALAAAAGICDDALRIDLQQTVIHGWMSTDPTAAAAWIGTQRDPQLRASLRFAAAKSIALTDPDLAAQLH